MPYKSGEIPKVGDRIKNKVGRQGTVTGVTPEIGQIIDEKLTIQWDDRAAPIEKYSARPQSQSAIFLLVW